MRDETCLRGGSWEGIKDPRTCTFIIAIMHTVFLYHARVAPFLLWARNFTFSCFVSMAGACKGFPRNPKKDRECV